MKQYLVSATEFESVSFINSVSTVCFSVGAFFLGFPFTRAIEYLNAPDGSPRPEPVYWALGALSLVCFATGWFARHKHGSIYLIIKGETTHDSEETRAQS